MPKTFPGNALAHRERPFLMQSKLMEFLIWVYSHEIAYSIRAIFASWGFRFHKELFRAGKRWNAEKTTFSSFQAIFRSTLPQLLLAIAFTACLYVVDFWWSWIPFGFHFKIDRVEAYLSFMGAVAATGGVFIALYYTALATVGSAIYTHVPNDIRSLLPREPIGQAYMRYLSFVVFFAISLMAAVLIGLRPFWISVVIVALQSGIAIIAFTILGAEPSTSLILLNFRIRFLRFSKEYKRCSSWCLSLG